MEEWQEPDLTGDVDGWYTGDPAELYDAMVELLEAASPPAWHRQAACRGKGPELFFPARGGSVAPARALCAGCPVYRECQATGLADESLVGVWGGLSDRDRRTLRRGAA